MEKKIEVYLVVEIVEGEKKITVKPKEVFVPVEKAIQFLQEFINKE